MCKICLLGCNVKNKEEEENPLNSENIVQCVIKRNRSHVHTCHRPV